MNKNITNLILETVSGVLLEGRLEDVKAKYSEEQAGDIDRLSQGDPSGNNKYLEWMANQLLNVGEHNHHYIIDAVKRFHNEQARINPTMSKEVVESNSELYPGRESRRVSNNPKDINSYTTIEGLLKVVEAAEENQPTSTERDKIYQDDKWTVIVPKTHKASCKYGVHSNWCVSTSNPNYFQSYTGRGMLAFVLWRNKQEGQMEMSKEGEYKVAAFIKYDNPSYRHWEWFNKKDNRMDNDLVLSILPPALIDAINTQIRVQMKASGFLVDVNEEELNEKAHLLSINGTEGLRKFTFIPKPGVKMDWLKKYDKENRFTNRLTTNDWTQEIPFLTLQEPNGRLDIGRVDLTNLYRRLKSNVTSWRPEPAINIIKNQIPFGGNLSEQKKDEVVEFIKQHFSENFKGYLNTDTMSLGIGDYVRWERATRRDRNRLGYYKQGKIIRQTPSGYFVVDVTGEDKPSRFKPDHGKYMDKRFEPDNLEMDIWDYVPEQR